jgi:hypothetical protein
LADDAEQFKDALLPPDALLRRQLVEGAAANLRRPWELHLHHPHLLDRRASSSSSPPPFFASSSFIVKSLVESFALNDLVVVHAAREPALREECAAELFMEEERGLPEFRCRGRVADDGACSGGAGSGWWRGDPVHHEPHGGAGTRANINHQGPRPDRHGTGPHTAAPPPAAAAAAAAAG